MLVELNETDDEMLFRLLDRCRLIAGEYIENNGDLYNVLTSGEMLEEDVASDRQDRREGLGFVTPGSAAAFLNQARCTTIEEIVAENAADLYTRAYFKALEKQVDPAVKPQPGRGAADGTASAAPDPKVIRFIKTLQNAEVLLASDPKMIGYDGAESEQSHLPLANSMRHLNRTEPELYFQRLNELSYLSNTLISGCGFQGRAFKPKEAVEAALSVCNLGGEYLTRIGAGTKEKGANEKLTTLLKANDLVRLFKAGWKIMFDDVVMFTAKTALECLDRQRSEKRNQREAREVARLADLSRACISSGRPWEFSGQLDYLHQYLDSETVMTTEKLLQEYPTLSRSVCNMGGHRMSPFIWSRIQILTVRRFLKKGFRMAGDIPLSD
ncbi:MAG: hypothetical protein V1816_09920 [Pseudomonadota bacterium]